VNTEAVLLLAHGTPDVLGEMDAYLKLVTGGRGVPEQVVHELQERYASIGLGEEPTAEGPHLTRWTLLQTKLLQERLGEPVYVAMRNWKPLIADVVAEMKRDGVTRVKAICLAPQNSRTSVGLYKHDLTRAVGGEMEVEFLAAWADHPLLAKAFAEKMRTAIASARALAGEGRVAALFTAHSVPSRTVQASATPVEYHGILQQGGPDPYETECRESARLVADELRDILDEKHVFFSFQSQGMSGGPWIGPTVEETLAQIAQQGYRAVAIQPVGFLCDHVEILYDVDVVFQQAAREAGLQLVRAESLNDSALLIDALEDLARHAVGEPLGNPSSH
jgi:protoporphyrin/coproporphyrin ferrochelatase